MTAHITKTNPLSWRDALWRGPAVQPKASKIEVIEALRGIAVLLVVLAHYTARLPPSALNASEPPLLRFHFGEAGVYIFFVISAYLIHMALSKTARLEQFFAKRISRIWPLYAAAAITTFVFLQVAPPPHAPDAAIPFDSTPPPLTDLLANFVFLQAIGFDSVDGVYWTIIVELKFYFLVGLLCYFAPKRFTTIFAAAAILAYAARFILLQTTDASIAVKILQGVFLAEYGVFFALGLLLAAKRFDALTCAVALLCAAQSISEPWHTPGFHGGETAFALTIIAALVALDAALFRSRVMRFAGLYSYGLYLVHQMIGLTLIKMLSPALGINLAIAISFGLVMIWTVLLSRLFEWRFRAPIEAALVSLFAMLTKTSLPLRLADPKKAAPPRP